MTTAGRNELIDLGSGGDQPDNIGVDRRAQPTAISEQMGEGLDCSATVINSEELTGAADAASPDTRRGGQPTDPVIDCNDNQACGQVATPPATDRTQKADTASQPSEPLGDGGLVSVWAESHVNAVITRAQSMQQRKTEDA